MTMQYCDDGCTECLKEELKDCKLCKEKQVNGTTYDVFMIWDSRNPDTNPRFVVVSEDQKERYEAKRVEILARSICQLKTINGVVRGIITVKGKINIDADIIRIESASID